DCWIETAATRDDRRISASILIFYRHSANCTEILINVYGSKVTKILCKGNIIESRPVRCYGRVVKEYDSAAVMHESAAGYCEGTRESSRSRRSSERTAG